MQKVYSTLSMCQKAGKVASGEFSCEKAVKELKAYLVLVAEDASDNTKKLFYDKCTYRNIPVVLFGSKAELGTAIGKEIRASVAILDKGFADSLLKTLGGQEATYKRVTDNKDTGSLGTVNE